MTNNAARLAYIKLNEKPTATIIKSMMCTGGRAEMREKVITGGWDREELTLTPVSRLDKDGTISGTYWLLLGEPKRLSITARDI